MGNLEKVRMVKSGVIKFKTWTAKGFPFKGLTHNINKTILLKSAGIMNAKYFNSYILDINKTSHLSSLSSIQKACIPTFSL